MNRQNGTGRQWLAHETRNVHQDLHAHPLLGQMTDPALTLPAYLAGLGVFQSAFGHIEELRRRAGHHSDLSLAREVTALETDLGAKAPVLPDGPLGTSPDRDCLLGALYTAHGSAFGASVMAKHVAKTIPQAPIRYLSLPHDTARWRQLVAEVNHLSIDPSRAAALLSGASLVFEHVRTEADARWAALAGVGIVENAL